MKCKYLKCKPWCIRNSTYTRKSIEAKDLESKGNC